MIRIVRIIGALLMVAGALVILGWLIKPIRQLWPYLFEWFRSMPGAIQIGLIMAVVGFLTLFSSIVAERLEDRKKEGSSLDDDDG